MAAIERHTGIALNTFVGAPQLVIGLGIALTGVALAIAQFV